MIDISLPVMPGGVIVPGGCAVGGVSILLSADGEAYEEERLLVVE